LFGDCKRRSWFKDHKGRSSKIGKQSEQVGWSQTQTDLCQLALSRVDDEDDEEDEVAEVAKDKAKDEDGSQILVDKELQKSNLSTNLMRRITKGRWIKGTKRNKN